MRHTRIFKIGKLHKINICAAHRTSLQIRRETLEDGDVQQLYICPISRLHFLKCVCMNYSTNITRLENSRFSKARRHLSSTRTRNSQARTFYSCWSDKTYKQGKVLTCGRIDALRVKRELEILSIYHSWHRTLPNMQNTHTDPMIWKRRLLFHTCTEGRTRDSQQSERHEIREPKQYICKLEKHDIGIDCYCTFPHTKVYRDNGRNEVNWQTFNW